MPPRSPPPSPRRARNPRSCNARLADAGLREQVGYTGQAVCARTGGPVENRSTSHRPERTCVGCRTAAPRDQLVRLVMEQTPEGVAPRVRADPSGSAPGRGAWLHADASCLDLALKRGGFARSFRGAVDTGLLARDLEASYPLAFQGNR
nr:YlxR family protein [Brachybacterium sp. ACRRE]